MVLSVTSPERLWAVLDEFGMGAAICKGGSALIKVNLAGPPQPGHPRSHPRLVAEVCRYVRACGARCAIAEGADGFLQQNLESVGLGELAADQGVDVVDLDVEEFDRVTVGGEPHYLPRRLKEYAVRIGMPVISKRPGAVFSANVKLFVGAVPRRMYQADGAGGPRPRVHIDLHKSVAEIYQAVMAYAPFAFYVDGANATLEGRGDVDLGGILVGSDAVELDRFVLGRWGLVEPEYITRLATVT